MVKISVIIPIYNVEDYLDETLNSLLNQTMVDDIEVLMIDDGSNDNSRYIIEKYALDYENFHAYHKKNEGQGIARNFGLDLAKGEFIHFMDSDDYLKPTAYEMLYNLDDNNDIIIGNVLRFSNYDMWIDLLYRNCFGDINKTKRNITLEDMPSLLWDTSTSNKLYRKEFLKENNIRFINEKVFYEDLLFALESYIRANSITVTPEIFYYWRFRTKSISVSQHVEDITNLQDRFKILELSDNLMKETNLKESLIQYEYYKWLNHDLKFFLKRISNFPKKYHKYILDNANTLIELIPQNLKQNLNSYAKILIKMVENNDINSLLSFAHLETELIEDSSVLPDLNEKYMVYVDFNNDAIKERLICDIINIEWNEDNLILTYSERINYLSKDYPHESIAKLVGNNLEYALEIKNNQIFVPIDLLKNESNLHIKLGYVCDLFEKEGYLKNHSRRSIRFDDFDIELGIGVDWHLNINCVNFASDNHVEITNISFKNNKFIFTAKSLNNVDSVHIKNVISSLIIKFPLNYNGDIFNFTIDYNSLLNAPIKKWELNCEDSLNSINLSKNFEFFTNTSKIRFINGRNKIIIENTLINNIDLLYNLSEELKTLDSQKKELLKNKKNLEKEIIKLKNSNLKLNSEINNFKSRKVIKLADKIKSFK